jgi:hypothetical protein
MHDVLLILVGIVAGFLILAGVIRFATMPKKPGKRSWLAPPSGNIDNPGKDWPGGFNDL